MRGGISADQLCQRNCCGLRADSCVTFVPAVVNSSEGVTKASALFLNGGAAETDAVVIDTAITIRIHRIIIDYQNRYANRTYGVSLYA